MSGKVFLGTFGRILTEQEKFRHMLTELIKENRWLDDEEERDKYYKRLGWALHGMGDDQEYESKWKNGIGTVRFQSYQRFLQKAGQIHEEYTLIDDNGEHVYAEPEKVWKNVKDAFLNQMGSAQKEAFRQSPEKQETRSPSTKSF